MQIRTGIRKRAAIFLFASMARPLVLIADDSLCPQVIDMQPTATVSGIPDGWVVTPRPQKATLSFVEIFDGPVAENVSLIPDSDEGSQAIWDLDAYDYGRGIWLGCVYVRDGYSVTLSKRLSDSFKECLVDYDVHVGNALGAAKQVLHVSCH